MAVELLERLRQITEEARRAALAETLRRQQAERAAAERIIADIPSIASAEAAQGRQTAAIMVVGYAGRPQFEPGVGYTLDAAALSGPSKVVWDYCVEQQLAPHLAPRWTTLESGIHRIDFLLCITW